MNKTKWLTLATSDDQGILSEIFKGEGYEFAIDGLRLHIAKLDAETITASSSNNIDSARRNIVIRVLEISQEFTTIEHFGVNPVYLIEALQAWQDNAPDQPVTIEYCHSKPNGGNFIRIQNATYEDSRQAIVMCMEIKPLDEKTQKQNENAKESENTNRNKKD